MPRLCIREGAAKQLFGVTVAKIKKLILVTAKHMPQHKYFSELAEELSKKMGVELEVREEDYAFLAEHGDTDEFGMPWTPQLLAELDDGRIVVLLSKMPFDEKTLKFDVNRALEIVMEKVKGLE